MTLRRAENFDESLSMTKLLASAAQKLESAKFKALVELDSRMFGARRIEQAQGYEGNRYVGLELKNLIWLHNYILAGVLQKRRHKEAAKMTAGGRRERQRRYVPNPLHLRNKNVCPLQHEMLEVRVLRQLDSENQAYNDYYRFLLGLIQRRQLTDGKIADKPVLQVQKLISKPNQALKKIS